MKKLLLLLCLATVIISCDYWPSHYFYIQNDIPNSEITIEFDNIDDNSWAKDENATKIYSLNYSQKKLVRIISSSNTGKKHNVQNVFDEFRLIPYELPFTLYVDGTKINKELHTKGFWKFTSYKGYGDYLLVINEELIQ